MTNKKDLIIVVLATFCLTVTLFLAIPVISQPIRSQAQAPTGTYDPWIDLNDDGQINILDAIILSNAFLTSGTPINKTELVLQLQSEIDSLNSSLLSLENTVATQQTTINNLGAELSMKLGAPDYFAEVGVSPGQTVTLTHNLNTMYLLVYMTGWSATGGFLHQIQYGGDTNGNAGAGCYWVQHDPNTISIYRLPNDQVGRWDDVDIRLWKIPPIL